MRMIYLFLEMRDKGVLVELFGVVVVGGAVVLREHVLSAGQPHEAHQENQRQFHLQSIINQKNQTGNGGTPTSFYLVERRILNTTGHSKSLIYTVRRAAIFLAYGNNKSAL